MGIVGRLDQYASMLAGEFDDYSMSENLLTYSEQFDNAAWNKSNISVSSNQIAAPDGTLTADKIVQNTTTSSSHIITQTCSITTAGTTITYSIFAKYIDWPDIRIQVFGDTITADTFQVRFNIQTGTIVSSSFGGSAVITNSSITTFPNGWYRCSATGNVNNTDTSVRGRVAFMDSTGSIIFNGNGTSSYYLWGTQLERDSVATDYTPTRGSIVTRILPSTTNTNITGLSTYFSSGFSENVGAATTLSANVFPPYDLVYDDFGGTLFGAGQGRYMRQNTDKSVIVYNDIDEVSDFYSRGVVRAGLVLDLDAGIDSSYAGIGTVWTDLSPYGNNGTFTNMDGSNFSSANGGILTFNGTDEYMTSSFSTTSGQAVTYCGWLYSTETTATYRNFVDSITARPMIWWNTSGQIEFDAAFYTTTTVYRNQWVYVALSKPSGNSSASYYVNGSLAGTGTAYTTPALTPTWFSRATAQTWKGNCSNVQVYNRALTAAEVKQNYDATKGRFGL